MERDTKKIDSIKQNPLKSGRTNVVVDILEISLILQKKNFWNFELLLFYYYF